MRMIRPRLKAPQVTIAEDQEEFKPVTAALVKHPAYAGIPLSPMQAGDTVVTEFNSVVMAFKPSSFELAQLVAGKPLYLSMLTFGQPLQGTILSVGDEETAGMYGLEVDP